MSVSTAPVEVERQAGPEIRPAPPRYRNEIGKFRVYRSAACIRCGRCEELCPYGVHLLSRGSRQMPRPRDYRCIGFSCRETNHYCIEACPVRALTLSVNPVFETLGDWRWTADLIVATWWEAETGHMPGPHLESAIGESGGGFDRMRFRFPDTVGQVANLSNEQKEGRQVNNLSHLRKDDISTRVLLNHRGNGRPPLSIGVPFYGGGMSFGSVSLHTMLAKARAGEAWDTFTCTGEGGYPDPLIPYARHVITQVATGLFGVREETIHRAPIIEFKYAQGAKPGLGGHLLADKVTPAVAAMREAVVGYPLFSPFPFHSVYSVEDHKKHLDWIAHINPRALLSVKVSTPTDVDMVAVGSYYAGAHIVHLDGSYGGTGAAPDIAKKNIAMPIEYAIPRVHQFLLAEGIRDEITVVASGGLRTPDDVAKVIALGADAAVIGTAEMVALGCIRCANCESGRGCARGIATTDPELVETMPLDWAGQRLINMYNAWRERLIAILWRLGLPSIGDLRGRTDLLVHLDYEGSEAKQ